MKAIAQHNPVRQLLGRPLRLGGVGGGSGSFIGPVHRSAAVLDQRFEVVAGVLSAHAERAAEQGALIGLAPARSYANLAQMLSAEALRPDGIEAVAVMTPNDRHFPDCCAALDAGLPVLCDKPMAMSVEQARALVAQVQRTRQVFCVSFNYCGYPMVRQARAMVADGTLGALRIVQAEYFQGGLARAVEHEPLTDKLRWKLDAARSGPSLVMGDIGSHAHHLATYVTGLRVERVAADIGAVMPQRTVDDYAAMLWHFDDGARGACVVTQAAAGAENNLVLRIYGERGMLEWQHLQPNYLRHSPLGEAVRTLGRGDTHLHPAAQRATRITRGHPEGFREACATIYADFAEAIVAQRGGEADPLAGGYPGVEAGLHSALFIDAALRSSRAGGVWTACEKS